MAVIFETERLIARHWDTERDLEDAFAMYSDPEVMRFLGNRPVVVTSLEEQRERLAQRNAFFGERNDGTGFWALEEKATKRVIGAVIVRHLPDADGNPTEDVEVGWHLGRAAWGKGFATEAGRAAIKYAFDVLRQTVVYAVVYKENTRSIAVTQRLGMTPRGPTDKYYGMTIELFEIGE